MVNTGTVSRVGLLPSREKEIKPNSQKTGSASKRKTNKQKNLWVVSLLVCQIQQNFILSFRKAEVMLSTMGKAGSGAVWEQGAPGTSQKD